MEYNEVIQKMGSLVQPIRISMHRSGTYAVVNTATEPGTVRSVTGVRFHALYVSVGHRTWGPILEALGHHDVQLSD